MFCASSLFSKESLTIFSSDLKGWKKVGAVFDSQAGKKDILRPKENTPRFGEIFLDFEGDVQAPDTTESAIYRKAKTISVINSSYIIDSKYSIFGKKSAYFSGKRNQIHLGISGSHFFGINPEPFTITIPLLISEQGTSSVVLDRTVFIKGKKYGFSLEIEENKLVFYVNNLLQKENGITASAILKSASQLPRKEWIFISIYFDTVSNRITLFQNGFEATSFESNEPNMIGIGFPKDDTSNLILAKSYFGNIDGFHIHSGEPLTTKDYSKYGRVSYDDTSKVVTHDGSYVVSPVYETKFSHSSLEQFVVSADRPTDTQVAVYFRSDNRKFSENETSGPNWIRLEENSNGFKNLKKFKYHQWKVWLRSDPQGKVVPSLFGLNYKVKEQFPPEVPSHFRITNVDEKEKSICFAWNSNHEREVQDKGGYMIHYGVEPDRMIGTLFVKSDGSTSQIDGKSENSDYKNLKFCADETTLLTNIYITDKDAKELPSTLSDPILASRLERSGLLFQNGITYYFKISAYNRFYDEWEGRDQKSKLSNPISKTFAKDVSQR